MRREGKIMGALAIIAIIYIAVKLIREAQESMRGPLGELDNSKMFKDSMSGMSQRDLKRNYKNGKYFK